MNRPSVLALALCAPFVVLASAAGAAAQAGEADRRARDLFLEGREAWEGSDYARAARLWQQAYDLSQRADLLFNIGNARLELGEVDAAEAAYRSFLAAAPEGSPERALADERLAAIAERRAAPAAARAAGPLDGRVVTWIALAATGAAGAVGTGLLVDGQSRFDGMASCSVGCNHADVGAAQTSMDVGNALMGTAALMAVATVVIWFVEAPRPASTPAAAAPGTVRF